MITWLRRWRHVLPLGGAVLQGLGVRRHGRLVEGILGGHDGAQLLDLLVVRLQPVLLQKHTVTMETLSIASWYLHK